MGDWRAVRTRALEVAQELARRGLEPPAVLLAQDSEVSSKRLFGRTETVVVRHAVAASKGWVLWQEVSWRDIPSSAFSSVPWEYEFAVIWLETSGQLTYSNIERVDNRLSSARSEKVTSTRAATDADLRKATFHWTSIGKALAPDESMGRPGVDVALDDLLVSPSSPRWSWGNGDRPVGAVEATRAPDPAGRLDSKRRAVVGALALGVAILLAFAVSGRADAPASGSGYQLARVRGVPVRWDPCDGPIRVAVNYGNLTPAYRQRALDAMQYGLARMSEETGLDFVLAGETDRTPDPRSSKGRRTDADAVVIGFLPAGTALMAGVRDDVAVRLSTMAVDDSAGWREISAADVHVRSKVASYQIAVLEGLARASGLRPVAKAAGPGVLARNPQGADYGEGDIAGLEAVGASRGCAQ